MKRPLPKKIFRFLIAMLLPVFTVRAFAAPLPVKVFILAGQSNMEGQAVADLAGRDYNDGKGTLAMLMADPAKAALFKHLKTADGAWTVRNDVFVRYQRENRPLLAGPLGLGFSVYGDPHHFGPELQFGHVEGDALENPVLLVKTAWGGKSLYRDFRPPSSGGETGKYYKLMVAQVREALTNLDQEFPALKGRSAELAGMVWYQGWNDGVDPQNAVPEYEQNLVNLIGDVRREFQVPELPVVIGELTGPWVQASGGWEMLRKAQAAAAVRPALAGNVVFVPTHDFVRKPEESPNPTHGHHEFGNAETYFLVGDALGKGMMQLLSAKTTKIKDYGLKNYVRLSKDLPHSETQPWKLVCTMPYNCHFQPWIEVESEAGQELRFNSSNPLVLYLTKTESAVTQAGIGQYEAKNWVSGEGAVYSIPAGVKVKAVQYRETGYDTSFAGSFVCNDHDYNVLWQKAARTGYICMRDHFYDCPDRERVGFWGDGTPELGQCFYVFDSKSHELCRQLVRRKLEPKFYPGQHLEFLGDYGLWFYYLQTGDLESMRAIYEPTKTFLFDTYQFGNSRTWFDWGKENKDTAVIETCFYYNCLGTLKKIALATGHEADIPSIDAKRDAIKSSFDAKYWKGQFYKSEQVKEPDDRANAMAVNVGLAEPAKWPAIYENVLSKKNYASCFFDRWVFEALCLMGKPDKALLRMHGRYRTMIPCKFSTLWEHYDRWWASRIDAFDDASSLNHGWNPPALFLSQSIAGISPETPGWTTFHVLPREAFLTSLKVVVPSIKGDVTVQIQKTTSAYNLGLIAPADTTAIVGIPKSAFSKLKIIKVNGVAVWNGTFRGGVAGVAWHSEDADFVKFTVAPGSWQFQGLGKLPLTSPKVPAVAPAQAQPLDKKLWTATASVPDGTFAFSGAKIPIDVAAANALNGDYWTGWRDMSQTQHPGQWFQVDMQRPQRFAQIVLDNTWALWDSPTAYEVAVSQDGAIWSKPIAAGHGELGITTITFKPQTARYIRITQTATNPTYHWSIYEFDVFAKT